MQINNTEGKQMQIDKNSKSRDNNSKIRKIVYFLFGALEVLLVFRLILKVLGANPSSNFVAFIYKVTKFFLVPFNGVFRTAVTDGIETKAVLEPTTIIALIVYALIAYGVVRLIDIQKAPKDIEIK